MVILAESLLGKGIDLRIYDRSVSLARFIGNGSTEFSGAVDRCRADQIVIDLVRIPLDFSTDMPVDLYSPHSCADEPTG